MSQPFSPSPWSYTENYCCGILIVNFEFSVNYIKHRSDFVYFSPLDQAYKSFLLHEMRQGDGSQMANRTRRIVPQVEEICIFGGVTDAGAKEEEEQKMA